ncbi:hypothetical protein LTR08_008064 [Meristemomyces frigidus]|nr:hypothetical protein LTR08_008064 [Meristemomyces frigidus]
MPSLAHISIPAYSQSSSSSDDIAVVEKDEAPVKQERQHRDYIDGPLPVRPSDSAPRNARIVGRVVDCNGAFYQLKIGEVELNDVGIDEILEYVSARHLEDYETRQFEEEAELLCIAEAEEERQAQEYQQRKKERALRKGTVTYQEIHGTDEGRALNGAEDPESRVGQRGRARPNYKHLFKKMKERRRRKRDPATGELMPLSDEDEDEDRAALQSSADEALPSAKSAATTQVVLPDKTKRRRRARDPHTGALLPLDPGPQPARAEYKKRPRRKRHPTTGELMPLGWRYNPEAPSASQASNARRNGEGDMSPSMKLLTISKEHDAKRVKLGHQSSSAELLPLVIEQHNASDRTSDSEETSGEDSEESIVLPPTLKPPPSAAKGQLGLPSAFQSAANAILPKSSPPMNTMTSMLHTPAADITSTSNSEQDEDELQQGEWLIEAILAHHMSDPRTHAAELGKKAVMLYQVKWENFEEPSWEPIESFPDRSVVDNYFRQVNDNKVHAKDGSMVKVDVGRKANPIVQQLASTAGDLHLSSAPTVKEGTAGDDDDEEEEEGTYEIEAILAHHMSDPRTHGPDFGKKPVMLYQVKWNRYDGTTWEPMDSFEDRDVVHRYRRRVGLSKISEAEEMN